MHGVNAGGGRDAGALIRIGHAADWQKEMSGVGMIRVRSAARFTSITLLLSLQRTVRQPSQRPAIGIASQMPKRIDGSVNT